VGGARNPQAVRVRELRRFALADAVQATLEVAVIPRLLYLTLFLDVQLSLVAIAQPVEASLPVLKMDGLSDFDAL
jgi:hypothetical protein